MRLFVATRYRFFGRTRWVLWHREGRIDEVHEAALLRAARRHRGEVIRSEIP